MKTLVRMAGLACGFAAALAMSAPGSAQTFPDRPLTIVVSFGPGSFPDTFVRIIAENMRETLKQPVIVDNRAGAGGAIGAGIGARAQPDGFTLTFLGSPHTIAMETQLNPGFDIVRDFDPVGGMNSLLNLLVVNPAKLPDVKSVKDLIAYAKANPGKLNFPSSGPNTPTDLANIAIGAKHGIDVVNVRYRDAPLAVQAIVSGETDAAMLPASNMLPHVQAGRLRALAILSATRWDVLPDLPNADEAGLNMYVNGWTGLGVPKGTPKDRIAILNNALNAAVKSPKFMEIVQKAGGSITPGTPEDMAVTIQRDLVSMREAVKAAGIQKQ